MPVKEGNIHEYLQTIHYFTLISLLIRARLMKSEAKILI